MNSKIILYLVVLLSFFGCQNDSEKRIAEQKKEAKKKEVIFDKISTNWNFEVYYLEPATQNKINNWMAWSSFVSEINQKPKSTIGAFQKKSVILSKRIDDLPKNIPTEFNKAQVKSRITVIATKIKMLDLYLHLNQIPPEKVNQLVVELNNEIISFQDQLEEIVIRSQIPREIGEPDFVKMRDTARAIPNTIPENNNAVFEKKDGKFIQKNK